jgi:hypothetical protein
MKSSKVTPPPIYYLYTKEWIDAIVGLLPEGAGCVLDLVRPPCTPPPLVNVDDYDPCRFLATWERHYSCSDSEVHRLSIPIKCFIYFRFNE